MSEEEPTPSSLPAERQFRAVLVGCCVTAGTFLFVFILLTLIKAARTPADITANWFAAWGEWAGGLATALAFLIAAYTILVASAHAHRDRQDAAEVRASEDMAQARLLIVYQVDMQTQPQSYRFYRIDNRSDGLFFDVTVPFAERYYESDTQTSRLTPEAFSGPGDVTMEYLPQGELLAPYRQRSENDVWFTEVRVYAKPGTPVWFAVQYTDAAGRQWKQHFGGQIERVITTQAVPAPPRKADSVQPQSQLRV